MPPEDLRRLVRAASARPALRLGAAPAGAEGRGEAGASLAFGRAHELCGASRAVLAAMAAGALERRGESGPVLWIRAPGAEGGLAPDGFAAFSAPGRLVLVAPRRPAEAPLAAEEALRSGAVALVVLELDSPLRMTPVRRLHLAAEAGTEAARAAGAPAPTALLLTPGEGGAEGVESRWRMEPAPSAGRAWAAGGAPRWRLERLRARLAPPRRWCVEWAPEDRRRGPLRLSGEADAPVAAPPSPEGPAPRRAALGLI
jgi:protein ImuA